MGTWWRIVRGGLIKHPNRTFAERANHLTYRYTLKRKAIITMETKIFIGICIFCVVAFFFLAICDVVKYAIVMEQRHRRDHAYYRGQVDGFKLAKSDINLRDITIKMKDGTVYTTRDDVEQYGKPRDENMSRE